MVELVSFFCVKPMQHRILIVGAGVSGLTTANVLCERGFEVVVLAAEPAERTPSVVAGALWEWQPAVCGHHRDIQSLARSKAWCLRSFRRFRELAEESTTGVAMRYAHFYFRQPVGERAAEVAKMNQVQQHLPGFRHDAALIEEQGINPDLGLVDAYRHEAPIIDTDQYMLFLREHAALRGCTFITRRLTGNLRADCGDLLAEYGAQTLVNCAGLGARQLTTDAMYPLRGALVRLVNDGVQMPKVRDAHCITYDDDLPQEQLIYVVPRGEDRLLLGGIAQAHEWDTELTLETPDVKAILERCCHFMPSLAQGRVDVQDPVRVGLRPSRQGNVRLEAEPDLPLIHNYGHGGSGFSLSWGCAEEVAELVTSQPLVAS